MDAEKIACELDYCLKMNLPVRDSLELLSGRWKVPILISLTFGRKRFKQFSKEITGITDRMLSRELKDLEMNKLIKREVIDGFPAVVEYSITPHGQSLHKLILELRNWGIKHRANVMAPEEVLAGTAL
jgi:DNA-binding HxlR family transcriptional regulator